MPDLKEIHSRIHETKKEKKKLTGVYRDALAQSKPYQDVLDELKALKTKKSQIEATIRVDFTNDMEALERLAQGIKSDTELLSDMALTKFMKGETVEITDENDVRYEPVFRVSFKKAA